MHLRKLFKKNIDLIQGSCLKGILILRIYIYSFMLRQGEISYFDFLAFSYHCN